MKLAKVGESRINEQEDSVIDPTENFINESKSKNHFSHKTYHAPYPSIGVREGTTYDTFSLKRHMMLR